MTGNDFENLFRFLRVKLRPAGAQQDSFTPETESEHLASRAWVWRIICVSLASQPVQAAISRVR
ncbi:Uncharacterised protein [Klebsiella pneumoniae]|nr:Uncharacterised protein [Klebsiella pneumoniae]